MGAKVTLVVPWLAPSDQSMVFPNSITFTRPEDQEAYVRAWVEKRTGLPCKFKLAFYPGRYAAEKCSILPVGDPTRYIPDEEVRWLTRLLVTEVVTRMSNVCHTGAGLPVAAG